MMPLLFRRSGGGASSATEAGAAVATAALLSATPAFGPLPLPPLVVLLLPLVSWEPLLRLDMVGPRPGPRCWGSLPTTGVPQASAGPCRPQQRCLVGLDAQGRHMVRSPRGSVFTRLSESSKPPPPPPPRGRGGGAGRGAPLRSGHRRRGALRSSPAARRARVQSRSHAALVGPRRGGGGSLQHLPLLPLPAAQIKKQQKATNHPRAERGAAGGGRSVRRPDSAGGAHGWARAGQGWDAGPGFGGQGSAALPARLGRLLSLPPPPLLPPVPPPLHPRSGSAASAAATAAARPPGLEL